mmetsp:Transcript_43010/g.125052  ORF Transcript_43010/g.125052 Transcript_43010/m.125052 type:complete len:361 (+) Transcript_43010:1214-2296(+)
MCVLLQPALDKLRHLPLHTECALVPFPHPSARFHVVTGKFLHASTVRIALHVQIRNIERLILHHRMYELELILHRHGRQSELAQAEFEPQLQVRLTGLNASADEGLQESPHRVLGCVGEGVHSHRLQRRGQLQVDQFNVDEQLGFGHEGGNECLLSVAPTPQRRAFQVVPFCVVVIEGGIRLRSIFELDGHQATVPLLEDRTSTKRCVARQRFATHPIRQVQEKQLLLFVVLQVHRQRRFSHEYAEHILVILVLVHQSLDDRRTARALRCILDILRPEEAETCAEEGLHTFDVESEPRLLRVAQHHDWHRAPSLRGLRACAQNLEGQLHAVGIFPRRHLRACEYRLEKCVAWQSSVVLRR